MEVLVPEPTSNQHTGNAIHIKAMPLTTRLVSGTRKGFLDVMEKLRIAFDIDGTLRCNCTPTCNDSNQSMISLAHILGKWFKNVELHAWSGGGARYAWTFVRTHGLGNIITENRCHSKMNAPKMDIAIDDQHEFSLADKNLIVRMK